MKPVIFINYRREDSFPYASQIGQRLEAALGKQSVFFDLRSIQAGDEFPTTIEETVRRCRVVLVLVGSSWLSAQNASGIRRLDDQTDWVRREILCARDHGSRLIPVLVAGARMPSADDLPGDLAFLSSQNAAELRDTHFDEDFENLVRILESATGLRRRDRGHLRRLARSVLGWISVLATLVAVAGLINDQPVVFVGWALIFVVAFIGYRFLR